MGASVAGNNPGNIRAAATPWSGQIGVDSRGFVQFDTPEDGIRAMAIILRRYQQVYSLYTVDAIVRRWAPPSENNTTAYEDDVAQRLGLSPNDWIGVLDPVQMSALIQAICWHENGCMPYTADQLNAGIAAAG